MVLVIILAFIPAGAAVLYSFSPAEYTFYPRCLFYTITGLHCPGCGATRCLHALLHGDLRQALAYNALFVVMLPAIALGAWQWGFTLWTGRPWTRRRLPTWSIQLLLAVLVIFWVLRNVDVYPFTLLAPHQLP